MTFPSTPLGLTVELLIDGTWTDITSLVYGRDLMTLTRGRSDEATKVDPSRCKLTANNRDGNLSPRNPTGTYYGLIGRNTRMRVRLQPASAGYLLVPPNDGDSLSYLSTPDTAGLSVTGDLDLRIDARFDDWSLYGGLANKYTAIADQRSWSWWKNADGTLSFRWSTDGTAGTLITKTSTAAVTVPTSGRLAMRITIDVDNGAAGNNVKFWTAPKIDRTAHLFGDDTDFEVTQGHWGAGNANTTVDRTIAQAHSGIGALALTSVAAGSISARSDSSIAADRFDVTAGDEIEVVGWFRAQTTARACQLLVNWYNGTTFLSQDASGTVATDSTSGWTKGAAVFTVPATATRAAIFGLVQGTGGAGEVHYLDDPQVYGGTTWTQLGSTVTTAGTTSIFDSTAQVEVGRSNIGVGMAGWVYAFQLLQGIAGTLRADVDMDGDAEADDTSFVGSDGLTWTLAGNASIVDPQVRAANEISEWPQRWDVSGRDVYVPLEASGIMRRLGQGATPLQSTLRRAIGFLANQPKAYWPCEDDSEATQLASAIGGQPMQISGTAQLASFEDFHCSKALPTLGDSSWYGPVSPYTSSGAVQLTFLIYIATGAATVDRRIATLYTNGTCTSWVLSYAASDGGLRLQGFSGPTEVLNSGAVGFAINDRLTRVSVELTQNGSDIDWGVNTLAVGEPIAGGLGDTLASHTFGRAIAVRISTSPNLGSTIPVGHVSVHDEIILVSRLQDELDAYQGEVAARRIERLCGEQGVAFRVVGNPDQTAAMGPQLPATLLDLLQEAATADGGILYEPRDMFGLAYRTRINMYGQAPRLELDYQAGHLSSMEPVDDDQQTRNDITVTRRAGSSARAVQETGSLSVQDPPDGIGRYDETVEMNLADDSQPGDAAGWLLHLGTVDEARYPTISVDLARAPFIADTALALEAQDLDIGDRLTITNPPAWLPPDDITQLAQGLVETMSNFTHQIGVNCSPESPWGQIAHVDDSSSRLSSEGSTLAAAITTTTATSASVATPTGPLWTHADGDFDIRVGGEVMTVTAISGATSPQTFTVTRSVNGVVKTHSSGAAVELDRPRVIAR